MKKMLLITLITAIGVGSALHAEIKPAVQKQTPMSANQIIEEILKIQKKYIELAKDLVTAIRNRQPETVSQLKKLLLTNRSQFNTLNAKLLNLQIKAEPVTTHGGPAILKPQIKPEPQKTHGGPEILQIKAEPVTTHGGPARWPKE